MFQDVRAMEIRTWFEGISVSEVPGEFLQKFASNPTVMLEPGNKVYELKSDSWSGYVLAGIMQTSEDYGEENEPSPLLQSMLPPR